MEAGEAATGGNGVTEAAERERVPERRSSSSLLLKIKKIIGNKKIQYSAGHGTLPLFFWQFLYLLPQAIRQFSGRKDVWPVAAGIL